MGPLSNITITLEMKKKPDNQFSANKAHEITTSIQNKNFKAFMNKIMEQILICCEEEGRTSTKINCFGVEKEIYIRAYHFLDKLKYNVEWGSCSSSTLICASW